MLKFGPAGIPISTPEPRGTVEGIIQCRSLGLDSMEVEFVHGVHMKEELAKEAGAASAKSKVSLSIHAPYYINLCSDEEIKLKNSRRHILESAHIAHFLNASPIVIHSGFYQGRTPAECEKRAKAQYEKILEEIEHNKWKNIVLGPELTGKNSAYGNLEEIVELSRHFGIEKVQPVIDFAHYHARTARLKTEDDFAKILGYAEKILGSKYAKCFHCHFSGIEYTEKGERKHIPVRENSPPFKPFLKVLKERGYGGTAICESPLLEEDALILQKEYGKL